jgi:2-oxoisovalerate dehydrogenase E1 component
MADKLNELFDWKRVAQLFLISRKLDLLEETELHPQKKVLYQFSARGHELGQILLGMLLNNRRDGAGAYYRNRPLLLTLGLDLVDAIASPMAFSGGFSDGRDIGVVCNLPPINGATVLPMAGDVGSQYTPCAGWAQAIQYHRDILGDSSYNQAIAVVCGGEGSVATNGFWSTLTMATTLKLPLLFYIEDNGYAISVPSDKQTPGANIAKNLGSFKNLYIVEGDGTSPYEAGEKLHDVVSYVRSGKGPALIRLVVPRLSGHSGQDTQAYKPKQLLESERERDPLDKLHRALVPTFMTDSAWHELASSCEQTVRNALESALQRPQPKAEKIRRYVFSENSSDGTPELQLVGGLHAAGHRFPSAETIPRSEPTRINMLTAIRRTLSAELKSNQKLLVFGEDVGPKGGVHAATMGLQEEFGEARVFDTSLSEEGIVGRAVGMALNGLMPAVEIQFRKYADPATEQLNNCGTIRWRTANRFAAPIVVRMPGGFAKCGDPWHSVCGESIFTHAVGWQVAFPSNAEDAVGLLREALRSNNPTIFFEHRHLLDGAHARRPYPGDNYIIPFGKALTVRTGSELTVVTWGAMLERCEEAVHNIGVDAEILDLRTLAPWDREAVLASVKKTRRCLIVHEDGLTCGFGAEIAATVAKESFFNLDAPVERIATPDIPIPYNTQLMEMVVPSVELIAARAKQLVEM